MLKSETFGAPNPVEPGRGIVRATDDATTSKDADSSSTARARRSTRTRRNIAVRLTQMGVVFGFLFLWWFASGRWVEPLFISDPLSVAETIIEWVRDGTLAHHGWITIKAAIIGFSIGAVSALIVGYALGVSDFWADVFEPIISSLWGLPRVALIPILIIWVGLGVGLASTITAIMVFFLLFFNTFYGIREVRRALINSVLILGGNRWDVAIRVRLPSALVWVIAGMKLSVPQALVGVVTAEMLASGAGLGYLVRFHAGQFNTQGSLAAVCALMIVGFVLTRIVNAVSRRALVWKATESPLA